MGRAKKGAGEGQEASGLFDGGIPRTPPHRTAGGEAGGDAPLVSRCISQRFSKPKQTPIPHPTGFLILPRDVKVIRDYGPQAQPEHLKGAVRGEVEMFSRHSASRLTRTARNAMPELVTQMVLTYHESVPDGEAAKRHLNAWLMALRRAVPGVGYLWILEFQTRGAPHFHVWLTEPYSERLWKRLGKAWNRIAELQSAKHLWWHTEARPEPKKGWTQAMIPWEMNGAGYLRKYMSKEAQKCVPDGFGWCGRFWGSTRNLVPIGVEVDAEDLPSTTTPTDVTRTASKWVEARRKRGAAVGRKIAEEKGRDYQALKLRPTARGVRSSAWLNNASPVMLEILSRLEV